MLKKDLPSLAQARFIARIWGEDRTLNVTTSYRSPTLASCIKRGWFIPTGNAGTFPGSSSDYEEFTLTADALLALECFLAQQRYATSTRSVGEAVNTNPALSKENSNG